MLCCGMTILDPAPTPALAVVGLPCFKMVHSVPTLYCLQQASEDGKLVKKNICLQNPESDENTTNYYK